MVKVSVLYPNVPGVRFDMDYYLGKHMALVREKSGLACKGIEVDHGLAGGAPDSAATYVAMGHILYDSVEAFQAVFAEHGPTLLADIPNFTNVQPVIQISDVKRT
ncbi:MAG TPA: EthD family reductase [Reyranella sp.]|nr:EthD family reductase [Reyranella sp.]